MEYGTLRCKLTRLDADNATLQAAVAEAGRSPARTRWKKRLARQLVEAADIRQRLQAADAALIRLAATPPTVG